MSILQTKLTEEKNAQYSLHVASKVMNNQTTKERTTIPGTKLKSLPMLNMEKKVGTCSKNY